MTKKRVVQDWNESLNIGALGVREVSEFLCGALVRKAWFDTQLVHNVEEDPRYQAHDIDLLWVIPVGAYLRCHTIEVKTDRNRHTGNFFFETVSVEHRDKPGAFVITRAEWLFYLFIEAGELFCFPMEELKPWFVAHEGEFVEKRARTNDNERMISWSTVGRVVPIEMASQAIKGCKRFKKVQDSWEAYT
jgi:hypothetical protein